MGTTSNKFSHFFVAPVNVLKVISYSSVFSALVYSLEEATVVVIS